MQVQNITLYPKYSPNRIRRTEAKNPNFGMKLVYDEANIAQTVGSSNVSAFKAIVDRFEKGLAERFMQVFKGSERLKQFRESSDVSRILAPFQGRFDPVKLVRNWADIKLELKFSPPKYDIAQAELWQDNRFVEAGNCLNPKPIEAVKGAFNNVLNAYVENTIRAVLKERLGV